MFFHVGYLEWGGNQQQFIFQVEQHIIQKATHHLKEIIHPFILIPFGGMVLLVIALFQRKTNKKLIYLGTGMMAMLILFLLLIGILSLNGTIILSTLPFLITSFILIRYTRAIQYN